MSYQRAKITHPALEGAVLNIRRTKNSLCWLPGRFVWPDGSTASFESVCESVALTVNDWRYREGELPKLEAQL